MHFVRILSIDGTLLTFIRVGTSYGFHFESSVMVPLIMIFFNICDYVFQFKIIMNMTTLDGSERNWTRFTLFLSKF